MSVSVRELKYGEKGLIPAIVQHFRSHQVLMFQYMNKESLKRTLETGRFWFYSRRQKRLHMYGERSGRHMAVTSVHADCDKDVLLVQVDTREPVCHTGSASCFISEVRSDRVEEESLEEPIISLEDIFQEEADRSSELRRQVSEGETSPGEDISESVGAGEATSGFDDLLQRLYLQLDDRKRKPVKTSYAARLFQLGIPEIVRRLGREVMEVIMLAVAKSERLLVRNLASLLYHTLILMVHLGIPLGMLYVELEKRLEK